MAQSYRIFSNTTGNTVPTISTPPALQMGTPGIGWFPVDPGTQVEAIFSLVFQGPKHPLRFCSNMEYEIYCDGRFIGIGGHRCTLHEVYADTWTQCAGVREVRVRVHWINHTLPHRELPLYRSVFPDPFFMIVGEKESGVQWRCFHETSVRFGAKISSQLDHQNIIGDEEMTPVILKEIDVSKWNVVDLPVELMVMNVVEASRISEGVIAPTKGSAPKRNEKYADDVTSDIEYPKQRMYYATYDLNSIGHSKIIIEDNPPSAKAPTPLLIVYSEIGEFSEIWRSGNRRKVRMADVVSGKKGTPFGYRGCRYIYLISSDPDMANRVKCTFVRATYPLQWTLPKEDIDSDPLLSACRANLLACVDGGIVDTCWRERVQWVGDLRMSAKALRAMTTDKRVVSFVLHQIADSLDPKSGLIQGAWPCRTPDYELKMPLYHMAFCLAAVEHDPTLEFDSKVKFVVEKSMQLWRNKYLKNGFISRVPGWMFTDWDFTDNSVPAMGRDKTTQDEPHAVLNAMWYELCTLRKEDSGINLKAYDNLFKKKQGYSLYPQGKPNIHATAAVICSGISSTPDCLDFLVAEKWNGNQVTAYYAYFIVEAFAKYDVKLSKQFINDYYLPIAQQHGSIYEKCNAEASMAHSWSIGFVAQYLKIRNTNWYPYTTSSSLFFIHLFYFYFILFYFLLDSS